MTIINKLKKLKDYPNFPDILLVAIQEIKKKDQQLSLAKKHANQQNGKIESLKFIIYQLKRRTYQKDVVFVQPMTDEERDLLKELM